MTRAQVEPDLARLRDFYARIPGRNPDGSIGVNLIVLWGNVVAPRVPPAPGAGYLAGVPAEWRDLAHGYHFANGPGGGGQRFSSRWSGGAYPVSVGWEVRTFRITATNTLEAGPVRPIYLRERKTPTLVTVPGAEEKLVALLWDEERDRKSVV
jgi:hypothetical protein